jgi:L-lactate permease
MKLPTKNEIITGCIFLLVGVLILAFLPKFPNVGWYAIFFGITVYGFPGPQLREKYKQTEETKARWRQSAKAESSKSLSWWASSFPYALLICLVVFVFAIVT